MWIAVIPAMNEENSITQVIKNVVNSRVDAIVLVANGCKDATCERAALASGNSKLHILHFPKPLGLDIPRAIGAAWAKKLYPSGLLFVDGDMKGELIRELQELIAGVQQGTDMALTNCYPHIYHRSELSRAVLQERETLNRILGLFDQIGPATPSHGPHAISARLLQTIPVQALAIPPLSLAWAATHHFNIGVSTAVTHHLLGSASRNDQHAVYIAQTITEDCRKASLYLQGKPLEKCLADKQHSKKHLLSRRFDILERFI